MGKDAVLKLGCLTIFALSLLMPSLGFHDSMC